MGASACSSRNGSETAANGGNGPHTAPPSHQTLGGRGQDGVQSVAQRSGVVCTVRCEQCLKAGAVGGNPELAAALWQVPSQALMLEDASRGEAIGSCTVAVI